MSYMMLSTFISAMTYETAILDYEDLPRTEAPVWVLGTQYSTLYDMDDIKDDVLSRLWFTYRKGYSAIGGTGPTQDNGWGCMLRCGQMMLAQALVNRHLTRGWRWRPNKYDPKYHEILRLFQDKKSSCYSIHQIASMGASEGKAVGQWFGPNTIAQVLRKLAVYDEWTGLQIHVAMDNTVIVDDIKSLCKCKCKTCSSDKSIETKTRTHRSRKSSASSPEEPANKPPPQPIQVMGFSNGLGANIQTDGQDKPEAKTNHWKPILLVIPLRLGLTEINTVYNSSLKTCLTFKQSVGIIGGKPNHAHWFIGFVEDELIYLDPHTTQQNVDLSNTEESDETYHCPYITRMDISQLDPSIALGFFCGTEAEFDDLAQSIQKFIIHGHRTPMFELHKQRPSHWPPFEPYAPEASGCSDFTVVDEPRQYDTDEEYELL